jgi:hypothetical protein
MHGMCDRSFVPPVRDEESETQRKAHAKRVRETRRSTQGVTLEEIKTAEQLVKKKQQQQLQQALGSADQVTRTTRFHPSLKGFQAFLSPVIHESHSYLSLSSPLYNANGIFTQKTPK